MSREQAAAFFKDWRTIIGAVVVLIAAIFMSAGWVMAAYGNIEAVPGIREKHEADLALMRTELANEILLLTEKHRLDMEKVNAEIAAVRRTQDEFVERELLLLNDRLGSVLVQLERISSAVGADREPRPVAD